MDANNLNVYAMSKFYPTSVLKWIDPKDFDSINTTKMVQNVVFSKLILSIVKNYVGYTMIIL